VIIIALPRPHSPPSAIPASTEGSGGQPLRRHQAVITLVSAITEPTDRSIPALMMIIVMPIAAMPTATVWLAVERKVSNVRK